MSDLMQQYMAGQLALMREFAVMFLPTVNSYKRTVPGTWAPTNVTWGIDNRTTALRAIPAGGKATRVEHRLPGADSNPYLGARSKPGFGALRNREEVGAPRTHNRMPTRPRRRRCRGPWKKRAHFSWPATWRANILAKNSSNTTPQLANGKCANSGGR